MIRFAMLLLLAGLCAGQPVEAQVPAQAAPTQAMQSGGDAVSTQRAAVDAALVLPGSFSQRTTVADLRDRFGVSNVRINEARDERGAVERSVVLFPGDPSRRAYLGFHDAQALEGLRSISVNDAGSRWRGKHGAHVGMSFAELRRRNGKAFWFNGFDDQQHGSVHDQWSPALDDDDGKLGAFDVDSKEHMYFGVELGLRGQAKDIAADAVPKDDSLSSDDPRYPRLGELVEVIALNATTSLDDEWE
jgi:hypothetical protein